MATKSKRTPAKPAIRKTSGRHPMPGLDARLSALSKRVHSKEQSITRARANENRRAEAQREAGDTGDMQEVARGAAAEAQLSLITRQ